MFTEWTLLVVLLLVAAVVVHAQQSRGLCRIDVHAGRVVRVRGKLPPSVLQDVRDVLEGTNAYGAIVVLRGANYPKIELEGSFSPETAQRLRNVLGNVRVNRFAG